MSIMFLLLLLFTIGAGLVAFSRRDDIQRTGFILEFVAVLIATILSVTGSGTLQL